MGRDERPGTRTDAVRNSRHCEDRRGCAVEGGKLNEYLLRKRFTPTIPEREEDSRYRIRQPGPRSRQQSARLRLQCHGWIAARERFMGQSKNRGPECKQPFGGGIGGGHCDDARAR